MIVISSRLAEGEYEGLKLLAKGCTKEAVLKYAERVIASKDEHVKTNAGTVIEIINKKLDEQIREDEAMHRTIREIFKEDFDFAESKGRLEGINYANERVASDMLREGEPLEKIARYSRLSEDTIRGLAKTLGIAIL